MIEQSRIEKEERNKNLMFSNYNQSTLTQHMNER